MVKFIIGKKAKVEYMGSRIKAMRRANMDLKNKEPKETFEGKKKLALMIAEMGIGAHIFTFNGQGYVAYKGGKHAKIFPGEVAEIYEDGEEKIVKWDLSLDEGIVEVNRPLEE